MHNITDPVRQTVDHQQLLRGALHDAVADVQPCDRLPHILNQAERIPAWVWALVATIGLLMVVASLLWLATDQPDTPPAPTTSLQEA